MSIKDYSKEEVLTFYREMYKIRRFELKAAELFMAGKMAGNIHTCAGQEACAVGACQALEESDWIATTHRGHGHCLAKGGQLNIMMAELFGKATGYCKGKGGSMHIVDVSLGVLGANGIVGAGIPIAAGSALATKIKGSSEVTVAFFGDGATNEGYFHEALNMASAWSLPCVFICENNHYGISTSIDRVCKVKDIATRANAYDIPGVIVDGNDVFAVHKAVKAAVDRARQGEGPSLIECKTYRHRGHYEGDPQLYKAKEEAESWKEKDPIVRLRAQIVGSLSVADEVDKIEADVQREIEAAVLFAQQSPYPVPEEVITDVYSMDNERSVAR